MNSEKEELRVGLVDQDGATRITIYALIYEGRELQIWGDDHGEAPKSILGRSDCEYCVSVPEEEKDRLLLALIEQLYSGDTLVVSKFRDFCESKNIKSEFWAWP